jgi:hypothetical protein
VAALPALGIIVTVLVLWAVDERMASQTMTAETSSVIADAGPSSEPRDGDIVDVSLSRCDLVEACQEASDPTVSRDDAASSDPPADVSTAALPAPPPPVEEPVASSALAAPFDSPASVTASTAAVTPASGPATPAPAAPTAPTVSTASSPPAAVVATATVVAQAATPSPTIRRAPRILLDERFTDNRRGWPDDPNSTAWLAEGGYRLFAREPSKFVAVGAPGAQRIRDVSLTAAFRKVGGPPGGGYGLVVRDQGNGVRDGLNQQGRYYVLEVGDRGEFGIWRRDGDRWIDLVPWTPSPAVRQASAPNEIAIRVTGERFVFLVNGVEVANRVDAALGEGTVGIFVGGDGNQVVLERLLVEAPE